MPLYHYSGIAILEHIRGLTSSEEPISLLARLMSL